MPVEVKIDDASGAIKEIKKISLKLEKLDKNFKKNDDDKKMQKKIEEQEKKLKKSLGLFLRRFITLLQTKYPKRINDLLKKEKYITNSKNSLTKFETKLIKSKPEEILEIFLDIFDLDENSPVKFKNDESGKELNEIVSDLTKLNLDGLLDLMLDDDEDDKKEIKSEKTANSAKSSLPDLNNTIKRILELKKSTPKEKSKKLKTVIGIANKSLKNSPKSKKLSPLLNSVEKKLDSIKSDSAIIKIAGVLTKLLNKIK